jgi:hypothetical protein
MSGNNRSTILAGRFGGAEGLPPHEGSKSNEQE